MTVARAGPLRPVLILIAWRRGPRRRMAAIAGIVHMWSNSPMYSYG